MDGKWSDRDGKEKKIATKIEKLQKAFISRDQTLY